jgi:quinol monooxygenase YgiN
MSNGFAAVVTLRIREEKLEKVKTLLGEIGYAMSAEPEFVHAWVHASKDDPATLVIYEAWSCDISYFMDNLFRKPYRKAYEEEISVSLKEDRRIEVLDYIHHFPARRGER